MAIPGGTHRLRQERRRLVTDAKTAERIARNKAAGRCAELEVRRPAAALGAGAHALGNYHHGRDIRSFRQADRHHGEKRRCRHGRGVDALGLAERHVPPFASFAGTQLI